MSSSDFSAVERAESFIRVERANLSEHVKDQLINEGIKKLFSAKKNETEAAELAALLLEGYLNERQKKAALKQTGGGILPEVLQGIPANELAELLVEVQKLRQAKAEKQLSEPTEEPQDFGLVPEFDAEHEFDPHASQVPVKLRKVR